MMECRDQEIYRVTPEWLATGLESTEEVRHEMLWRYTDGKAGTDEPRLRAHLADCRECARLAQSFTRLASALHRRTPQTLAVCPSAADLAGYHYGSLAGAESARIQDHVAACPACREELDWLARTAESNVVEIPRSRWTAYAIAAAAVVILAILPVVLQRGPTSPTFADLADVPALDRKELMDCFSQKARFMPVLESSFSAYERGGYAEAESKARQILAAAPADPSALFMVGMARYRQGDLAQAHKLMQQSERTRPLTDYRCWTALQFALLTGDRAGIDRECQHVDGDPRYQARARKILETVRKRTA